MSLCVCACRGDRSSGSGATAIRLDGGTSCGRRERRVGGDLSGRWTGCLGVII